jgi:hypothetical protein
VKGYDTYDELLEEESTGWVVVVIGKEKTPKEPVFANVVGPWPKGADGKRLATNYAAKTRARFKRERDGGIELIKASVRPLWKEQ